MDEDDAPLMPRAMRMLRARHAAITPSHADRPSARARHAPPRAAARALMRAAATRLMLNDALDGARRRRRRARRHYAPPPLRAPYTPMRAPAPTLRAATRFTPNTPLP